MRRSWVARTSRAMTSLEWNLRVLLLQFFAEVGVGAFDEAAASLRVDEGVGLAGVERRLLGLHGEELAVGAEEHLAGKGLPGREALLVVGGLAGIGLDLAQPVAGQDAGRAMVQ